MSLSFFMNQCEAQDAYIRNAGEACGDSDLITSLEDCQQALTELDPSYNFRQQVDDAGHSPGCFIHTTYDEGVFNSNSGGNTYLSFEKGVCRDGGTIPSYYIAEADVKCEEDQFIESAAECQTAVDQLAVTAQNFDSTVISFQDPNSIKFCHWNSSLGRIYYNEPYGDGSGTDVQCGSTTQGGICKGTAVTSGAYIKNQADRKCKDEDKITTLADCEAAMGEISSLSGESFGGLFSHADRQQACWFGYGSVYFNDQLDVNDQDCSSNDLYSICRVGGSPSGIYQEAGNTPCPDDDMITTLADCQTASAELSGYSWIGEIGSDNQSDYAPGCIWITTSTQEVWFNPDFCASNGQGSTVGGLCRTGGTVVTAPANGDAYLAAGDTPCSTQDMITTLEDCFAARDELLSSYSPQLVNSSDKIPGCSYDNQDDITAFNTNFAAVSSSGCYHGGICRVGGTVVEDGAAYHTGITSCSSDDTITRVQDCQAAFNELGSDYYTWAGEWTSSSSIPGCYFDTTRDEIGFNSDLDATSLMIDVGGICRTGGSPSIYRESDGTACSSDDMITTEEDCEAALGESSYAGVFTWEGAVSDSGEPYGCFLNGDDDEVYFNSNTANTSPEDEYAGFCRTGGTVVTSICTSIDSYDSKMCNDDDYNHLSSTFDTSELCIQACAALTETHYYALWWSNYCQCFPASYGTGETGCSSSLVNSVGKVWMQCVADVTTTYPAQLDTGEACTSGMNIISKEACYQANIDLGLNYTEMTTNRATVFPYCYYDEAFSYVYFNKDSDAVYNTSEGPNIGALCQSLTQTIPQGQAFQEADGCSTDDLITTLPDCEAAFNELLSGQGYTWNGEVTQSDKPAGCYYNLSTQVVKFNHDLAAINGNADFEGLCRKGGTPETSYYYKIAGTPDNSWGCTTHLTTESECQAAKDSLYPTWSFVPFNENPDFPHCHLDSGPEQVKFNSYPAASATGQSDFLCSGSALDTYGCATGVEAWPDVTDSPIVINFTDTDLHSTSNQKVIPFSSFTSTPTSCKTAEVSVDNWTWTDENGNSMTTKPSFISFTTTGGVYQATIVPDDSMLTVPFRFNLQLTDPNETISASSTQLYLQVTDDTCDLSDFIAPTDITVNVPSSGTTLTQTKGLTLDFQNAWCGTVSHTYSGEPAFVTISADTFTIEPTLISQIKDHVVDVTQRLNYDTNRVDFSSSYREETTSFMISVTVDCTALTYVCEHLTTVVAVGTQSPLTLSPSCSPGYDYGSGVQTTDSEGNSWADESVCGSSVGTFSTFTEFMTISGSDLLINPTLDNQIGIHTITQVLQSGETITTEIEVVCGDSSWAAQTVSTLQVEVGVTTIFTPEVLSSPLGCYTSNINYKFIEEHLDTYADDGAVEITGFNLYDSVPVITWAAWHERDGAFASDGILAITAEKVADYTLRFDQRDNVVKELWIGTQTFTESTGADETSWTQIGDETRAIEKNVDRIEFAIEWGYSVGIDCGKLKIALERNDVEIASKEYNLNIELEGWQGSGQDDSTIEGEDIATLAQAGDIYRIYYKLYASQTFQLYSIAFTPLYIGTPAKEAREIIISATITKDTCDANDLNYLYDFNIGLFQSTTLYLSKFWAEEPFQSICGTYTNTYSTRFMPVGSTSYEDMDSLTSDGLPDFITLTSRQQDDPAECTQVFIPRCTPANSYQDDLDIAPVDLSQLGEYEITVTQTIEPSQYGADVAGVDQNGSARVLTDTFILTVQEDCTGLSLPVLEAFTEEIYLNEEYSYVPNLTLIDSEGREVPSSCTSAVLYDTCDTVAQFETKLYETTVDEDQCIGNLVEDYAIYPEQGERCQAPYLSVLDHSLCQQTISEISGWTTMAADCAASSVISMEYGYNRFEGCFTNWTRTCVSYNSNHGHGELQEYVGTSGFILSGICHNSSCRNELFGKDQDYSLTLSPTTTDQLGSFSITLKQFSVHLQEKLDHVVQFDVKLRVETIFELDTQDPLEFLLFEDEAILVPYTITTQEPYLAQTYDFEFRLDGLLITDWVSLPNICTALTDESGMTDTQFYTSQQEFYSLFESYELNPPEENRSYSSVWDNNAIGTGHAQSALDSDKAWVSYQRDVNQWMILDAGEQMNIAGIIVQGRANNYQHEIVDSLRVQYSDNSSDWTDAQSGQEFITGITESTADEKKYFIFDQSISARYIKILPQTWTNSISMRAGLIVGQIVYDPDLSSEVYACWQPDNNTKRTFFIKILPDQYDLVGFHTIDVTLTAVYDDISEFSDSLVSDELEGDTIVIETSFDIAVQISVETTFTLDTTSLPDPLEFLLDIDQAILVPYTITTQEPILAQTYNFEFRLNGNLVTDWVTVDQATQIITILPEQYDLVGSHTFQITLIAVYDGGFSEIIGGNVSEIVEQLANDELDGDTMIFQRSFDFTILALNENSYAVEVPYFEEPFGDQQKELGAFWQLDLLEPIDPLEQTIQVSFAVSPSANFIQGIYDSDDSLASLTIDSNAQGEEAGIYVITLNLVTLEDDEESRRESSATIVLTVISDQESDTQLEEETVEEEEQEQEEDVLAADAEKDFAPENQSTWNHGFDFDEEIPEFEFNPEKPAPKVSLESMSHTGNVTLAFNQQMNIGTRPPNQYDIRMTMVSADGVFEGRYVEYESEERRLQQFDDSSPFSWTIKKMAFKSLEIQIDFNDPLEVSSHSESDRIEMEFISDYFVSQENNKTLNLDLDGLSLIEFQIPQQFESEEQQEEVMAIADIANAFAGVNIVVLIIGQIFAGQLIKKIIPLFMVMQLIFHIVDTLPFPINTSMILGSLDDAVKMTAVKNIITEQLEENETVQSFKDLADQSGMIVLIGVPFVLFLTIVAVVTIVLCKKKPKCQQIGIKLKDKLVFNTIIQVSMVSSLAFCIQAGFGRVFNNSEDRAESSLAMVLLMITLLGFTLFFPLYVDKSFMDEDKQFETTYGILYKKYRYWNPYARLFLFFFFLHRIGFVFTLNIQVNFSATYLGLMIVNVSWVAYLLVFDPYLEAHESRKELVNSYLFLVFTYFIPAYTHMTPDPKVRFSFGKYTIIVLGTVIFINLVWTIGQLIQEKGKKKYLEKIRNDKIKAHELEKINKKYIIPSQPSSSSSDSSSDHSQDQPRENLLLDTILEQPEEQSLINEIEKLNIESEMSESYEAIAEANENLTSTEMALIVDYKRKDSVTRLYSELALVNQAIQWGVRAVIQDFVDKKGQERGEELVQPEEQTIIQEQFENQIVPEDQLVPLKVREERKQPQRDPFCILVGEDVDPISDDTLFRTPKETASGIVNSELLRHNTNSSKGLQKNFKANQVQDEKYLIEFERSPTNKESENLSVKDDVISAQETQRNELEVTQQNQEEDIQRQLDEELLSQKSEKLEKRPYISEKVEKNRQDAKLREQQVKKVQETYEKTEKKIQKLLNDMEKGAPKPLPTFNF